MRNKIKLINYKTIRFSPEIEVEFPNAVNSGELIQRHRILMGWEIARDGSLENGAEYRPKKSNKLYYNRDSLMQLKEILALIKCHKGKVSESCGLHVHIDMSKFTDAQVLQIIKEFVHKQRYFVAQFKVNKKRLEKYCNLVPRKNLTQLSEKHIHSFRTSDNWSFNETWDFRKCFYLDNKYHALNASHLRNGDYNTLEFRLYTATLNYKELCDRIEFTLKFIKDSLERE